MRGLILSLLLLPVHDILAQRYSFGVGAGYGNEIETLGYQVRAYYNIGHKICFGPELTLFPKTEHRIDGEDVDITLREINFNGHYIIETGIDKLGIYPIGGLNYSVEEEGEESIKAWGVNIGGGIHYAFNHRWTVFSEFIHLTGDLSEETGLLGVFYTLQKKHSDHD